MSEYDLPDDFQVMSLEEVAQIESDDQAGKTAPKRYVLEGFEDFRGDFDTGIYLVKPVIACIDASRIENVVEDFCIDASIGLDWEDDEPQDVRKRIQNCFYRVRKKDTRDLKYFRAVVEVYSDDENEVYRIIEKQGW
jgi:hypothetical protein